MMLESVTRFIFDNIGNQLSMKKIADTMTLDGRKIHKLLHENLSKLLKTTNQKV